MALERIHLARDFLKNVVHAGQILFRIFQAGFRQTFLGLELCDSRSLFDDGAAVGRTAAEDLSNASLFDQRIGFWTQAGAHEKFLDVAQAAQLAIEQIFAVPRTEQAARDHDLSPVKLLLKFTAADLQHNLWGGS